MSMGALLYKAMSKMSKYELELMKLANNQAINYAKSYAGYDKDGKLDINAGVVGLYLNSATSAANEAGKALREDAKNALIQACVGGAVMAGMAGGALMTRSGDLDEQIEDTKGMQKAFSDGPNGADTELMDVNAKEAGRDVNVQAKIDDWKAGGDQLKNFEVPKTRGMSSQEEAKIDEQNQFNKKCVEQAKASPTDKAEIKKKIEERLQNLNQQKDLLSRKFQGIVQSLQALSPSFTAAFQTSHMFDKAAAQAASQIGQADAQVLSSSQQQQEKFITTQQQDAESFKQAADAAATGYGQIVQTRG